MKKLALVAMLGALTCAPVLAQEAPAPPPPDAMPAPPNMKAMMQVHADERVAMLNALSPEHKQLLASLAGQLTIAAKPDYDAATKQLDAALTPTEKQAITAAQQAARDKMEAAMKEMGPPAGAPGGNHVYRKMPMTPGSILLQTAMGGFGGGQVFVRTMSMEAQP